MSAEQTANFVLSGGTELSASNPVVLVLFFVALALVPFLILSLTSFIKLSVVFGILRNAIGAQQVPSGAIITLISMVLTMHIMTPVVRDVKIAVEQAVKETVQSDKQEKNTAFRLIHLLHYFQAGVQPVEWFLEKHSRNRERVFFASFNQKVVKNSETQGVSVVDGEDSFVCEQRDVASGEQRRICKPKGETFFTLIPAFVLSELREGFAMGFSIFLPFLIVDLVIANLLVGLGMMMVPPVTVSLPFKIMLFVLCDGWFLLSRGLILGYQ